MYTFNTVVYIHRNYEYNPVKSYFIAATKW